MAALTSAQHVFMFLWIMGSVAAGALEAKPGEDVTLQCNSHTDAAVEKLVWSRPGLKDGNVFFFRDNLLNENYQDPRYHGRVELKDPQMKNGDASVVLKNVDYDDSGTYQCEVRTSSDSRRKRKVPVQSIHLIVSKDPGEVRAKPGEDVTLQCNSPTDADITKIKWERPDLKGHAVFFVRENRPYEKYQDPRYHGRVELKDPEMKNGDVSVVLKNVTVNDTGTYQCWVTIPTMPKELLRSVHLIVSEASSPFPWWAVALLLGCRVVVGGVALRPFVFLKPKSVPL
ncbi:polymeric immunoglobulin receptor-like [Trematomus bernacchii]|uniref:polymeric immunoglobulin receptor-like n=1 Tax=Trematomus bernacchii TaxID=40690 RepID=UPI00146CA4F8|nr:polymeric immunoglobulin receptor-like [Trematomus bernacchii]